MTLAASGTGAPAVIVVSASGLGARSGGVLHEVAAGAVVRVDDLKLRRTVAWITADAPEAVRAVEHLLPAPGEHADAV